MHHLIIIGEKLYIFPATFAFFCIQNCQVCINFPPQILQHVVQPLIDIIVSKNSFRALETISINMGRGKTSCGHGSQAIP